MAMRMTKVSFIFQLLEQYGLQVGTVRGRDYRLMQSLRCFLLIRLKVEPVLQVLKLLRMPIFTP